MTDREVMQMALEIIETHHGEFDYAKEIAALRAQLEQPEQEPVALIRDGVLCWHIPNEHYSRPTWTAHGTHMLYTRPPQRKQLTDDEVVGVLGNLRESITGNVFLAFARAIEAAHGIKVEA